MAFVHKIKGLASGSSQKCLWAAMGAGAVLVFPGCSRNSPPAEVSTVESFTPLEGVWGTRVTVKGARLAGITTVRFGKAEAKPAKVQETQLEVDVPEGALTGPITIDGPGGQVAFKASFKVLVPEVTKLEPALGPPETEVVLTGVDLHAVTAIAFNGTDLAAGSYRVEGSTRIHVKIPPGAKSSAFTLTAGSRKSKSGEFTVTKPSSQPTDGVTTHAVTVPLLTVPSETPPSETPPSATPPPANPPIRTATLTGTSFRTESSGTIVTLTGTHLDLVTGVAFGGVPLSHGAYTLDNPGQIRAILSAGAINGALTLATASGPLTSSVISVSFSNPTLDTMAPVTGAPMTEVVLTGTHLDRITGAAFGGQPLDPGGFTPESDTRIRVRVPLRATASGAFTLTGGTMPLTSSSFALAFLRPTLLGLSVDSGVVGSSVVLTGENFGGAPEVRFGAIQAGNVRVESPTQLTVLVPGGASGGRIRVVTPGGSALSAASFHIVPTITSLAPNSGPPGSVMIINGTGLGAVREARFVDTFLAEGWDYTCDTNGTQLTVKVPASAANGPITLFTAFGHSVTSVEAFTVAYAAPRITHFTPNAGVPGTQVTLHGDNLAGVTELRYNGAVLGKGAYEKITNSTTGEVTIHARVPPRADSGRFTVRNEAGHHDSGDFNVTPLASRRAFLAQDMIPSESRLNPYGGVHYLDYPAINRTPQYNQFDWPRAPIFHAYNPWLPGDESDHGRLREDHNWPKASLNFQLPAAFAEVLPPALLAQIDALGFPRNQVEILCVSQDQPYNSTMLFRPQYWLYPDTPTLGLHTEARPAGMGIYSADSGIHFEGQAPGAFLNDAALTGTSVHPMNGEPPAVQIPSTMISSPANLRMAGLDFNHSHAVWSLVHDATRPGVPPRMVATLHIVLNDADQGVLETWSNAVGHCATPNFGNLIRELSVHMGASPARGSLLDLVRPRVAGAVPGGPLLGGGVEVTVTGSGFGAAGARAFVTMDGIAALDARVEGDNQIVAAFNPAPAPGNHVFVVDTEYGLDGSGAFIF